MPIFVLEIVEGPGSGRQIPLDRSLELGREDGADVVLEDDLVSRRHARISPSGDGGVLEDLTSTNGTFLNGDQVHGLAELKAGDQVLIGVTLLEVRAEADVRSRPTAVREKPPALAMPAKAPDYVPPEAVADARPSERSPLDPLLDVRTKAKTRSAVLALFVLVVLAVLLFLATR